MTISDALEVVGTTWGWFTTPRVAATAAVAASAVGIQTLRRNKRDSQSRSRPMVGAELQPDGYAAGTVHLIIRNYGQAVARNVKVTFEPPLPQTDGNTTMIPFIERRYANAIPTLMPGTELSNVWPYDSDDDNGMPEKVTVIIESVSADKGLFGNPDRYRDEFILDMNVIKQRTYVSSSASPDGRLKAISESLKTIAKNSDN